MIKRIEKPWGYEEIIEETKTHVIKRLVLNPNSQLSLQYHNKKIETMFLVDGLARLELGSDLYIMELMKPYYIKPFSIHRLSSWSGAKVIEVSTTELDDVVRLEDSYGRAPCRE